MRALFSLLLLLIFVSFAALFVFGETIYPSTMGVRRIGFGPGEGFHRTGLKPGLHWSMPFASYTTIYKIPTTIQSVQLHRDFERFPDSLGPLEVQTANGAKVVVDATLLIRFFEEPGEVKEVSDGEKINYRPAAAIGAKHGGPADLIEKIGPNRSDWFQWVKRNGEDELKRALGKLSTAQFYLPDLRERQSVLEAQEKLYIALLPYGIELVGVLLGRYSYQAEEINQAIARKNLQDQEERLNATKSQFASVSAELRQREADLDAQIKTLKITGESEAEVIVSEGALIEARLQAQGELLVAKAKAEVDRAKAGLLSGSSGAEVYVARELAPLLSAIKGGILNNVDPLDLIDLAARLGVSLEGGAERGGRSGLPIRQTAPARVNSGSAQ